jgi:hypothetical protein
MRPLSKFALTATLALITSSGVEISPVVAGLGGWDKQVLHSVSESVGRPVTPTAMQVLDGRNPASFEPEPNKPPSRTGGSGTR